MRRARRGAAVLALWMLTGCQGDPLVAPRVPPAPPPASAPSPAPSPDAAPSPAPVPTSDNRPPKVSVSGGGSCHPRRTFQGVIETCEVQFTANAHDPDGDPLTYAWSGCASGTERVATCTIDAIHGFTATVKVKDGRGGSDTASGTAQGVNQPPRVRFGGAPPDPAASNAVYTMVGSQPTDPEDDADSNSLCGRASVTYSGPCWAKLFLCGGVADGFDVDIKTLDGPGTCALEARVEDPWGAVGTDRIVFQVGHP